jgi:hypothetical protein
MNICRQCFREKSTDIGFSKVRFNSSLDSPIQHATYCNTQYVRGMVSPYAVLADQTGAVGADTAEGLDEHLPSVLP